MTNETVLQLMNGEACQTCKSYSKPMCNYHNIFVARKNKCDNYEPKMVAKKAKVRKQRAKKRRG